MSSFETLLGFDARQARPNVWFDPDHERAHRFLLRTDVDEVLSADATVWPSIFNEAQLGWIGMNPPFWSDFRALHNALRHAANDESASFSLLAATWHSDVEFEQGAKNPANIAGLHFETGLEEPDLSRSFLGYDITDGGFISGLSNCAYTGQRDTLAAEWAASLNRSHLFEDLEQAFRFRTMTNVRVPEHAPFFVVRLWSVREA